MHHCVCALRESLHATCGGVCAVMPLPLSLTLGLEHCTSGLLLLLVVVVLETKTQVSSHDQHQSHVAAVIVMLFIDLL